MLDITRIDAETSVVGTVPVSLDMIVKELLNEFRGAVLERQIEIKTHYAKDVPVIHADPNMIQKALYQLLVNAIKYTPDGGSIDILTRAVDMDDDAPGVEIVFRDTGIGLDLEHHELVFEKFYQVGSVQLHSSGATVFKGGGPGLGLAIVRGVAQNHGGKVWVESPGHDEENFPGSSFYLQLPITPPAS
jgi:signal transduction histidine kinase